MYLHASMYIYTTILIHVQSAYIRTCTAYVHMCILTYVQGMYILTIVQGIYVHTYIYAYETWEIILTLTCTEWWSCLHMKGQVCHYSNPNLHQSVGWPMELSYVESGVCLIWLVHMSTDQLVVSLRLLTSPHCVACCHQPN